MGSQSFETSVATSFATRNWWELHSNPLSFWCDLIPSHPSYPSYPTSSEEGLPISSSLNSPCNHSSLTFDSPPEPVKPMSVMAMDLSAGEPCLENPLWSQVLLNIETNKTFDSCEDDGDNFIKVLSSKNLMTETLEAPCDYLNKFHNSWELESSNSIDEQLTNCGRNLIEHERLTTFSDTLSNWSIALPDSHLDKQIAPITNFNKQNLSQSLFPTVLLGSAGSTQDLHIQSTLYLEPGLSQIRRSEIQKHLTPYLGNGSNGNCNVNCSPRYGHVMKGENQLCDMGGFEPSSYTRLMHGNRDGNYCMGVKNSLTGDKKKQNDGILDGAWSQKRQFTDFLPFGGCLNKSVMDLQSSNKLSLKSLASMPSNKPRQEISQAKRGNARPNELPSERKKRRIEDKSETLLKKPKHEAATNSSPKVPKVRFTDRIGALQQIVSPFGKTDAASVLFDTIEYIKSLQNLVQLHSSPYLKSAATKDHGLWGGLERNDKGEAKLDLKSRGLCLVPISSTPQACREITGPDYWSPIYRGCLYR